MGSILLVSLIAVPAVGAVVAAAVGANRPDTARGVGLITVLVNLALTAGVLEEGLPNLQARTLLPQSVAGQPDPVISFSPIMPTKFDLLSLGGSGTPIQFFVGLDGLNVW